MTFKTSMIIGVAAAALAGVALAGGASAQWGGPWGGGPGFQNPMSQSGPQTQGRRTMMTGHGHNMDGLDKMFDGRLNFNRDRALRIAREIEASAGESLWKQFEVDTHAPSSRVTPRILSDFDTFQAYAETLKYNAGVLIEALERNPAPPEVYGGRAYVPRGSYGTPYRGGRHPQAPDFGAVDIKALQAYAGMVATCNICHTVYRGWR